MVRVPTVDNPVTSQQNILHCPLVIITAPVSNGTQLTTLLFNTGQLKRPPSVGHIFVEQSSDANLAVLFEKEVSSDSCWYQ